MIVCLTVLAGRRVSHVAAVENDGAATLVIPVFPGASLLSKLPEQGEASFLSFGSYSEPEEIRRYFTMNEDLGDWRFTGETAGSAGVVLKDGHGRRLIVDVRVNSSCLLFCQHLINYWLTTK
ncbi:MAG: hypothetical protein IT489_04290 [Gammaproteobacteria bacterium]|nr:hypothetical protein [Gammaproteobacteria bacterium]